MAGHERPALVQKWLDPSAPFETLTAEQQEAITAACTLLEEFARRPPRCRETFLELAMPVRRDRAQSHPIAVYSDAVSLVPREPAGPANRDRGGRRARPGSACRLLAPRLVP